MGQIREYNSEIQATGEVTAARYPHASAQDFGGDMGLQNFGQAVSGFGDKLQQVQERDEISDAQAKLAEARLTWTQQSEARFQAAEPGDKTVMPKLHEDIGTFFGQMSQNYQTKAAQQYVKF